MGVLSKIEWCDATWNPVVGCSIQSKGCTNCYAMKQAARLEAIGLADHINNFDCSYGGLDHYQGTTKKVNGNAVWTGKVAIAPQKILEQPLHWKKPRRIFVNSMGDLFHENVPMEWIDKVFAIMAMCPQHTFIILTKNPKKMKDYIDNNRHNGCGLDRQLGTELRPLMEIAIKNGVRFAPFALPLPNVWLGVSVENQETANERIPILLDTPAAVRFISAEPLLGEIDLNALEWEDAPSGQYVIGWESCLSGKTLDWLSDKEIDFSKLDWVIVGGESGKNARPMHPDWVRKIRDDCAAANVPFFFKQWGKFLPFTNPTGFARVGKKTAGNTLDGAEHLEFPKIGGA